MSLKDAASSEFAMLPMMQPFICRILLLLGAVVGAPVFMLCVVFSTWDSTCILFYKEIELNNPCGTKYHIPLQLRSQSRRYYRQQGPIARCWRAKNLRLALELKLLMSSCHSCNEAFSKWRFVPVTSLDSQDESCPLYSFS